ncbi:MAG TPA: hypothetical protein VFK44_07505, partial [Bacillales bacterium]|nr:hypothetical protein [Bacillales bacterium]
EHPGNDVKTFHNEQDAYCKSLFAAGDEGVRDFQNTHEAFKVWWDSFAGRFSVERSIDEKRDKLYEKLSAATEGNALNIGIIYDDCRLADTDGAASYAVASIRDFYVNEKELAAKWQKRPG